MGQSGSRMTATSTGVYRPAPIVGEGSELRGMKATSMLPLLDEAESARWRCVEVAVGVRDEIKMPSAGNGNCDN